MSSRGYVDIQDSDFKLDPSCEAFPLQICKLETNPPPMKVYRLHKMYILYEAVFGLQSVTLNYYEFCLKMGKHFIGFDDVSISISIEYLQVFTLLIECIEFSPCQIRY